MTPGKVEGTSKLEKILENIWNFFGKGANSKRKIC